MYNCSVRKQKNLVSFVKCIALPLYSQKLNEDNTDVRKIPLLSGYREYEYPLVGTDRFQSLIS